MFIRLLAFVFCSEQRIVSSLIDAMICEDFAVTVICKNEQGRARVGFYEGFLWVNNAPVKSKIADVGPLLFDLNRFMKHAAKEP